jgi:transposase
LSKRVLPLIPSCLVVDQVLHTPDRITIVTSPRRQSAPCPSCAIVSRRIHSRYQRTLHDLPWQGQPVTLCVQARRFRCLNPACARQTFAEPLADAARPFAQRTERLGQLQCHLGLALSGEAGARLAERLAMPVSADTLLRLVQGADRRVEHSPVLRVLAVDHWSWRRGRRYGTILVDLERNAVVDLLPDRQADSLAECCVAIPTLRLLPVIVQGLMRTGYVRVHRMRFRCAIGGICCAIWGRPFEPWLAVTMPISGA